MTVNRHLETKTERYGAAPPDARLAVVLVHGRGQTPSYLEEQVVKRLGLADITYRAPAASGQTWYPKSFLAPFEENEPQLGWALERLEALCAELVTEGFPRTRQVLLGFSQGACLSAEFILRQQHRFGGLIALTGGFVGPDGTRWESARRGLEGFPVLMTNGDNDPWVPLERFRETVEVLGRSGAEIEQAVYPGRSHEICDDEIDRARTMLRRMSSLS